ncbi:hypothetical protein Nans01_28610 [Nocardiopsis ansamitocini]|uniref:DUF1440 domain-containing protein n=2 Tax=Nocardiopsis ansamitocini TaxID=1670832 RepID=A0A9W6P7C2_9ACTN|nr:hypothetical protein Nans01_28610 [Nocardiopsis ansamitocini]
MKSGLSGNSISRQPPKLLVRVFLPKGSRNRPRAGENPAAFLAHLGFGAAAGAVFGAFTGNRPPRPFTGAAYALAVWAAAYEGWVPAVGAQPPAHRDDPRRATTLLVAHLVYGTALAAGLRRIRVRRQG